MIFDNKSKELSVGLTYSCKQIRDFVREYGGLIVSDDLVNLGHNDEQVTVDEITEMYHYPLNIYGGFQIGDFKTKTYKISKK